MALDFDAAAMHPHFVPVRSRPNFRFLMPFDSPSDASTPGSQTDRPTAINSDATTPVKEQTGASFRDSRWRPALSCAGALGLGMALAPLLLRPAKAPISAGNVPLTEIVLARESTLVMTPTLPPGALLRGRLRLVAGTTDAVGRAPVGGQVARQLVENGARVQRGDAVVEISSGVARRVAPASESLQNRAEQSQIAATDAQNALAQKIATAQIQLRAAQERVARAQTQTGVARDVVRRLQNGESVAAGEIPAPFVAAAPNSSTRRKRRRKRATGREESRPSREIQVASRQAEAARDAAQESARALVTARAMLFEAQNVARQAEEKAESSAKAVVDVETRFDDKKASGADVESARIAQKEAQGAVNTADKALILAKAELGKREKSAATTQNYAQTSASQAAKTLASGRLEQANNAGTKGDEVASTPPDNADNAASGAATGDSATAGAAPRVTLDNAIRFASGALEESQRASREADRLHNQIESYQSQVTRSNSRIETATQDLANAQQGVMDSVPRARFTSTLAPSSGIVTWISRLAREVGVGDAVFGIAGSQRVAARFEDKSGLWRAIKPGTVLTAFVVDAPTPEATTEGTAVAKTAPDAISVSPIPVPDGAVDNVTQMGAGHAVSLKMTEVTTPESPEKAATLTGAIVPSAAGNGATDTESLTEGAQILVSVPRPDAKSTLSVPASALIKRGDATYIGVLAPLSAAENKVQNRPENLRDVTPSNLNNVDGTSVIPTAVPTAAPTDDAAPRAREVFHLRWVRVETGRSDGLRLEIVAGLRAGERIVSAPDDLEAMGFLPVPAATTIFDTGNAPSASNQASQPAPVVAEAAPTAEVLVRLTQAMA